MINHDSYKSHNNFLVNKLMYSFGVGIDFVTYYDKILRFDYSLNALGESGFLSIGKLQYAE